MALLYLMFILQPIQALDHPKFHEMVNVASRATNRVNIPGQKSTRNAIIQMFKDHLMKLKVQLNVSVWQWLMTVYLFYLGPICCRRSQFDLWRVASKQRRWLFCCHRTLDRRICTYSMGAQKRTPWLHATFQFPQRRTTRAGSVQDCGPSGHNSKGTSSVHVQLSSCWRVLSRLVMSPVITHRITRPWCKNSLRT